MWTHNQRNRFKRTVRWILLGGAAAYVALTGCSDMVLTGDRAKWRDRMVNQMVEKDDPLGELERLAINYLPEGYYPKLDGEFYSDHRQYCIDRFLKSYKHYQQQGCANSQLVELSLYATVTDVLEKRLSLYEDD